jgi:Mpv17 / PMP22 family
VFVRGCRDSFIGSTTSLRTSSTSLAIRVRGLDNKRRGTKVPRGRQRPTTVLLCRFNPEKSLDRRQMKSSDVADSSIRCCKKKKKKKKRLAGGSVAWCWCGQYSLSIDTFILWTLSLSLLLLNGVSSFTAPTTTLLPRRQFLTTTTTTQVNLLPPHFLTSILHYNHISHINAMMKMKKKKTGQAQKSKRIKIIHPPQHDHHDRSLLLHEPSHHMNTLESSSSSSSMLLLSSLSSSAVLPAPIALSNSKNRQEYLGKMLLFSLVQLRTTAISVSRQRLCTAAVAAWTRAKTSISQNCELLSVAISRRQHHVITRLTLFSVIMGLFGYVASMSSTLSLSTSSSSLSSLLSSILAVTVQAPAAWYMRVLLQYPLVTKSITSGVIGTVADFMAQKVEYSHEQKKQRSQQERHQQHEPHRYDARRGASRMADGCFASGPMMHFAYEFMEHVLPIAASSHSTLAAMTHVLADTLLLDSIFVATTFLSTGILEGYAPRQLLRQFRQDYIPAIKVGWLTSFLVMPIEVACFRFFPLSFRVLAVDMIDILWDSVMSFMMHRNRPRPSVLSVSTSTLSPSSSSSSSLESLLPDVDDDGVYNNNSSATSKTKALVPQSGLTSTTTTTELPLLLPELAVVTF